MAHGYLRDYDEAPDRDDERNRERWREEDRERGWRGRDRDRERGGGRDEGDRNERNLNFMLGDRDRNWERGRGDRSRSGDEDRWSSRDWRGSGEDDWRSGHSAFTSGGDWERSPRNFGSHQDDHYRSWRDRQMEALDRDYADYCKEREQQFHQDFDSWRSKRRGNNPGPLRTGMTQTGQSHDPSGTLELRNEATDNAKPDADPMDAATLGTNSSGSDSR